MVEGKFFIASQILTPLVIAVRIIRCGLWEIDFIINRTVVYGLLITVLAVA